ncbi:hypothetical protein CSC16_2718 [Proteus mirabilis]|nr:hypothetical protein CSC16_2718 [Proteus mirabilis]
MTLTGIKNSYTIKKIKDSKNMIIVILYLKAIILDSEFLY